MAQDINPEIGKISGPGPGPGQGPISGPTNPLPESPLVGSSSTGAAVTGTASGGNPGISGASVGRLATGTTEVVLGDGVFGTGLNGIHGVSDAGGCGVKGEGQEGYGVFGSSTNSDGVHGETAAAGGSAVAGINSGGGNGVYGSSTGNAGFFQGNVNVTGAITTTDVTLTGADCAEEFDTHGDETLEPGTVVAFDAEGSLNPSDQPYSKNVAGVVSGAGQFRPGVILDRRISSRKRIPVALVGKVFCKVDASFAPIDVGDLLTTSPTLGHAMKAAVHEKAFGAIIGKALASLNEGCGLIPILVALG